LLLVGVLKFLLRWDKYWPVLQVSSTPLPPHPFSIMSYNPYAPATNSPAAPYMGYRSLPPSPPSNARGLSTPPETQYLLPSTHVDQLSYALNPTLADIIVAFLPQSSQRNHQPATKPPVSRLRLECSSPHLPWRIEVQASNRTTVTVSDVWHALHTQLYIQLTAAEQLQFTSSEIQTNYCQRVQHSPGYFPYPCRIDVLCGRVRARFGPSRESRGRLEVAVEFY
jgi:hypothetical protein